MLPDCIGVADTNNREWHDIVIDCFHDKSLNIDNFESYSSFSHDEYYIQSQKNALLTSNIDERMQNCTKIGIDDTLNLISKAMDYCINAHEPSPEILSNYCNYEIPEERYGESEPYTPDDFDF